MHSQKTICIVCGARPNFIKIAPLIREIKKYPSYFSFFLVHTGQHFDANMNDVFFKQLEIQKPDYFLNACKGTHAEVTAEIMVKFEKIILSSKPDLVIVVGDVNSTLACAVTSKKCGIKIAHIEAGLRSGDMRMPEEINRIITDSISDLFFITEESGLINLRKEGKDFKSLHYVGNIMIDSLYHEVKKINKGALINPEIKKEISSRSKFALVTIHRPSNVDRFEDFSRLVSSLICISNKIDIFWPVHPRTEIQLKKYNHKIPSSLKLIKPLPYRELVYVMINSEFVITDSGGIQEETTALKKPCLTFRENTERPITVRMGSNTLIGTNPISLEKESTNIINSRSLSKAYKIPKYWDGKTSERICNILKNFLYNEN